MTKDQFHHGCNFQCTVLILRLSNVHFTTGLRMLNPGRKESERLVVVETEVVDPKHKEGSHGEVGVTAAATQVKMPEP